MIKLTPEEIDVLVAVLRERHNYLLACLNEMPANSPAYLEYKHWDDITMSALNKVFSQSRDIYIDRDEGVC